MNKHLTVFSTYNLIMGRGGSLKQLGRDGVSSITARLRPESRKSESRIPEPVVQDSITLTTSSVVQMVKFLDRFFFTCGELGIQINNREPSRPRQGLKREWRNVVYFQGSQDKVDTLWEEWTRDGKLKLGGSRGMRILP